MLKNYFKTSVRNLLRSKGYSFINIVGLTIGLATSIFIFLWVIDEISVDQFHKNDDRLYRVMSNWTDSNGKVGTGEAMPLQLAEVLQAEVPEIEYTLRTTWEKSMLFQYHEKSLMESGIYADSSIFKMLTFPLIKGDVNNPMPDKNAIAISEKLARKYFGDEDPMGKVFRVARKYDMMVTAVFTDPPQNSTLRFDFIIPFDVWRSENIWANWWGNGSTRIFTTLKPGADLTLANEKVKGLITKNCDFCHAETFLFPSGELYLRGEFVDGKNAGGRIDYVISLSIVAIVILIIACINFMNLATARSATRSREVGVRKVIGANRTGLIVQFIGESVLLSVLSMIFALAIVQLLLPFFNEVTDKHLRLDPGNLGFTGGLALITLFCGLLAGSYPAFFLSSFKPAQVLKGNTQSSLWGGGLRKALVIVQFTASVILIIGSIVVYNQIGYIRNKHLGFDKENIIVLDEWEGVTKNQSGFRADLLQFPQIKEVGVAGDNPFNIGNHSLDPVWPGKSKDTEIGFKIVSCDQHFIPTLGMTLVQGRNFGDNYKQDSCNYIINEKAMEAMSLTPENVIGTPLEMWNGKGKIIGLLKDFHNGNLRENIEPLIMVYTPQNTWRIYVRIQDDPHQALASIEHTVKKYDPDYPFQYSFLNDDYNRQYRDEEVMGKLSLSFTVVAILISCLGLFGLALFTSERRVKELGIRKVLGASVTSLLILLCSDFAKLVFLALLIACPIAWYLTREYLSAYAYHAPLDIWIFILTATGILLLAMLTVSYQSIKAAIGNPVDSLRSE
jgi:putative ABC transport system permease protein